MNIYEMFPDYFIQDVKSRLSEDRYIHTLGVVEMADIISEYCYYPIPLTPCIAAFLHDITKEYEPRKHYQIVMGIGKKFTDDEREMPEIWHAFSAPVIIWRDFPEVATHDVFSAVWKHTVCGMSMSLIDWIVYISDFTEKGRTSEAATKTREWMLSSFIEGDYQHNRTVVKRACLMAIEYTEKRLLEQGKKIHPKTIKSKKALISELGE